MAGLLRAGRSRLASTLLCSRTALTTALGPSSVPVASAVVRDTSTATKGHVAAPEGHLSTRHLSTGPPDVPQPLEMLTPEDKEAVEVVRLMLKQAAMHRVRRELKVLAADRPAIPEAEFRRLLIDKQVATTPEESEEMFKALVTAGVVLPYHRVIYLKPDEIMGKMIEMLPDAHETPMEIEEHIREVETEYVPLAEQRQSFSNVARRRAATLFGLGVAGLAAWGVVMVRLTWWELSWDVIEPIAYFSGLVGNIALWSYSMRARHDPTYENIFQRMVRRYEDKRMQLEGFDLERYKDMEATLDRLRERRRMMRLVNQPSG